MTNSRRSGGIIWNAYVTPQEFPVAIFSLTNRWFPLCCAVILSVATALCSAWLHFSEMTVFQEKLLRAPVQHDPVSISTLASPKSLKNFPADLPVKENILLAISELQRSSSAAGIAFKEVSVRSVEPSLTQLGSTELSTQLRGAYSGIKQVLFETQARYPNMTLRRLSLRRSPAAGAGSGVEASAALVLWAQPQRAAEP